jgi:hypothetical protein
VAERRRYTKREKASAVTAAMATSTLAAAETTGIPRKTIAYWLEHPQFATLRQKTREDLAQEMSTLAHLFAMKLSERVDELEPRDLVVALGIVTDKAQLLSGAATGRIETKAITDGLGDEDKRKLRDAIDRWHERLGRVRSGDAGGSDGGDPVGVGAEVRE